MQKKINGEEPFKCIKDTFSVGATEGGYTLSYSVDKEIWTDYPTPVPANENLIVNDATPFLWFKLTGNAQEGVDILL